MVFHRTHFLQPQLLQNRLRSENSLGSADDLQTLLRMAIGNESQLVHIAVWIHADALERDLKLLQILRQDLGFELLCSIGILQRAIIHAYELLDISRNRRAYGRANRRGHSARRQNRNTEYAQAPVQITFHNYLGDQLLGCNATVSSHPACKLIVVQRRSRAT